MFDYKDCEQKYQDNVQLENERRLYTKKLFQLVVAYNSLVL